MAPRKLIILACCTERWMQVPVGTFGLSSHLTRHGIEHYILHSHTQPFETTTALLDRWIDEGWTFALVLHWKEDTPTFYTLSHYLKSRIQDPLRVVCGGITAAFFTKEILEDPMLPDVVFRGDPEVPVLAFCQGASLDELENVAWSMDGIPTLKPITSHITPERFNTLSFTDFSRMVNAPAFLEAVNKRYLHVNISRGCAANCEYCGGSRNANLRHSNRTTTVTRAAERVVDDVCRLHAQVRGAIPNLSIHFDDFWPQYFPVLEKLSRTEIAASLNITVSDRGPLVSTKVEANMEVFKAFHKFTFELSPESDDATQRGLIMEGTGKEVYESDYLLNLVDLLSRNGIYSLVFYTVYNARDTEAMIFQRMRTFDAMRQGVDSRYSAIICAGLSLDCGSDEYMDLAEPPGLAEYREPTGRFTRLLGNVSYIWDPKDVDLLVATKFLIVLSDLKMRATPGSELSRFEVSPELLMATVRELQLGKLIHQDFVRSGKFVDFLLQKLRTKLAGAAL